MCCCNSLAGNFRSALEGIEWNRFPLAEMAKRGWIQNRRDLAEHAEEIMRDLIRRAGGEHVLPAALYRKNDSCAAECEDGSRIRSKLGAGRFWRARMRSELPAPIKPGTVDLEFLRKWRG